MIEDSCSFSLHDENKMPINKRMPTYLTIETGNLFIGKNIEY